MQKALFILYVAVIYCLKSIEIPSFIFDMLISQKCFLITLAVWRFCFSDQGRNRWNSKSHGRHFHAIEWLQYPDERGGKSLIGRETQLAKCKNYCEQSPSWCPKHSQCMTGYVVFQTTAAFQRIKLVTSCKATIALIGFRQNSENRSWFDAKRMFSALCSEK